MTTTFATKILMLSIEKLKIELKSEVDVTDTSLAEI